MHNNERDLPRVLDAIEEARGAGSELIVVDDCSTDNSAGIASSYDAIVVQSRDRLGPAEARNLGVAQSKGSLLCFVDSDCLIEKDTIALMCEFLENNPEIVGVFGTYNKRPPTPDWSGRYKNLYMHFTYQNANENTRIFSTACGCVRRDGFDSVGGFSELYLEFPGMQDVYFGYRLSEQGRQLRILKNIQITHLKDWGFMGLLRADLIQRGIPWMKMILTNPERLENERNLKSSQRLCLVLVYISFLMLLLSPFLLPAIGNNAFSIAYCVVFVAIHFVVYYLNRDLLWLMWEHSGPLFALYAYFMHYIYFLNCGLTLLVGTLVYYSETRKKSRG